nr:zinc finger, CCHC-type [Tanacetum cinerariifolium]
MVQEAHGSHRPLESSGSDEGLELNREEDTQPFKNTSEEHAVEPQNVEVPICRSTRIPQAPDRYGFYVDVEEFKFGDINEPPNYKVALSYPESDKWLETINTEMKSMKDNQVWILVELPPNGQNVRSKWLFKKKTDTDGNVYTFKVYLGEATYVLGIKIIRDRSKRLIALSQSAYLEKTLKKFRMENSKKLYPLMMEKPYYRKSQEAEYIAAAEASMESVWMIKFIDGHGNVVPSNKRPMEMLCDNEPAIVIANDPKILKGPRHFQRKYHYTREVIQEHEIVLKKVHINDNVAGPFTKLTSFNKHFEHAMAIKIVPASSLM